MKKSFGVIVVLLLAVYIGWIYSGTSYSPNVISSKQPSVVQWVDSSCTKTLIGIQPWMVPDNYLDSARFLQSLLPYFKEARDKNLIRKSSVVVLPEYLGTWLVIAGEKSSVAEQTTLNSAMMQLVLSNPVRITKSLLNGQDEEDFMAAAIFRMNAERAAAIYSRTFKYLSSTFGTTIVAGSIVLPGPSVENDRIVVDLKKPLYNVSFVFEPDGKINPRIVYKSFPISSEKPFLSRVTPDALPSFETPAGRMTVMICADSWYPDMYAAALRTRPDFVVVPSYCTGEGTMHQLWKGYDGSDAPADVNTADIGHISERDAWQRYALPGRISSSGAAFGINVFLRGNLWDLGTDGVPQIIERNTVREAGDSQSGLWAICLQ